MEAEVSRPWPPEKPKLLVTFQDFLGEYAEEGKGRFLFIGVEENSVNSWLDEQREAGAKIEEITISSVKGYKAVILSEGYVNIQVAIAKDKYVYKLWTLFGVPDTPKERVFCNQMLSTFKFLD